MAENVYEPVPDAPSQDNTSSSTRSVWSCCAAPRRILWRFGERVLVTLGIIALVVWTYEFLTLLSKLQVDPWGSHVPWSPCSNENGTGTARHEMFLNRLAGRRVVFVGDCILRYQYIELAYYLIHGRCPDPSVPQYILSERHWPGGFNELLSESSAALNVHSAGIVSQEFTLGGRFEGKMLPLFTSEERVFTFRDNQGRILELVYLNYYTEKYGTLGLALTMADILHPTDVVVNFGVWLSDTPADTTCGDTHSYWPNIGKCPYMPEVCDYFTGPEQQHQFHLFWATTTPGLNKTDHSRVVEKVPRGHNLNAVSACGLPPEMVLDRGAMLTRVEPNRSKQPALFDDAVHFLSPEPYHAFNWMLLDRLPQQVLQASAHYPAHLTAAAQHTQQTPYGDGHMHAPALVKFDEFPASFQQQRDVLQ